LFSRRREIHFSLGPKQQGILSGSETQSAGFRGALHEPYAHLYVGDYFADTLDLTAREHRALRLLLLETWTRGFGANSKLAAVVQVTKSEWQAIKPVVLPLIASVRPRIAQSLKQLRAYDGQRLPSADWEVIRSIIFERDGQVCTYCGSNKLLEGDHIVPLSRGGSNTFGNLATACRPCNQSKGSKTVEEWRTSAQSPPRKSPRRIRSKERC
jgi:5-methylcytosine-specific restriction endonuclease McrA